MKTIPSIFEYIGTTQEEIENLTKSQSQYFVNYSIRKSDGKRFRYINAPKGRYKAILEAILHKVLYLFGPHKIAHGFVFKRGPKTNAMQHLGADTVCKFDLTNFFNTINTRQVVKLLIFLLLKPAYPVRWTATKEDCILLGKFLCYCGKVPQGAPTSPAISNLVCYVMDQQLFNIAETLNDCVVTRYADDITFSFKTPVQPAVINNLRLTVHNTVKEHGFKLHPKKTRTRTKKNRLTVTGIVVNSVLNIDATKYSNLRAAVHNYVTGKTKLTEQEEQQLRGKLAWLDQLNPAKARPLILRFSQYQKSQVRP